MTEYIIFVLVIAALIVGGGLVAWAEATSRRQVWIWALIGAANLTAAVKTLWGENSMGWFSLILAAFSFAFSLYHHKKDTRNKEDAS